MKKFFQSKGFIVSSLVLLCITILGVCWFVSRDRTGDFRPDESPPSSVTGDWSDGGTQTDGDNGADIHILFYAVNAGRILCCTPVFSSCCFAHVTRVTSSTNARAFLSAE